MSRSSESHGTYQTTEEYNEAARRRAASADPRDATIAALQAELGRVREALTKIADGFGPNHMSRYCERTARDALSPTPTSGWGT